MISHVVTRAALAAAEQQPNCRLSCAQLISGTACSLCECGRGAVLLRLAIAFDIPGVVDAVGKRFGAGQRDPQENPG